MSGPRRSCPWRGAGVWPGRQLGPCRSCPPWGSSCQVGYTQVRAVPAMAAACCALRQAGKRRDRCVWDGPRCVSKWGVVWSEDDLAPEGQAEVRGHASRGRGRRKLDGPRCAGMRQGRAGRRWLAGSSAGGTSPDARAFRGVKLRWQTTRVQACRRWGGGEGE